MPEPQTPEEEKGAIEEHQDGTIIGNVALLRMRFVRERPEDVIDQQTRRDMQAISNLGTMREGDALHSSITITYNTKTGQIQLMPPGSQFGDYSILRTELIETGDIAHRWQNEEDVHREILLHRRGDMPAVWDYDEALSGIETGPKTDTRRIMPERIIPEYPQLHGINEIWGQSKYTNGAGGDLVMLKTIRKFNQTFGPPK